MFALAHTLNDPAVIVFLCPLHRAVVQMREVGVLKRVHFGPRLVVPHEEFTVWHLQMRRRHHFRQTVRFFGNRQRHMCSKKNDHVIVLCLREGYRWSGGAKLTPDMSNIAIVGEFKPNA